MADNKEQAKAASEEVADNQTAAGQETDAADTQKGTNNPLAAYEAELAAAMAPAEEGAETQEESEEATADAAEETEQESSEDGAEEQEDAGEPAEEKQTEESSEEEPGEDEGDTASAQRRYRFKDPTDIAVAAIAKAKDISLVEAAKLFAGEQATAPAPPENESGNQDTGEAVETAQQVSAQIKELLASKKEKLVAYEFDEAADIDTQIEELRDRREELKETEAQEKSRTDAANREKFETKFTESEESAVKFYPDASNHNSPLSKRMAELDQQAKQLGDPIFYSPDKPFLLAKAAARELGILMTNPGKTPPAAKKAATTRPIQLAGGNARTSAPANATSQLDQAVADVKDEAAYEKVLATLGV